MALTHTFSPGTGWRPDQDLLARIKRSYRTAVQSYQPEEDSMWTTIEDKRRDIHRSLFSDDDNQTIALLSTPARTELYWGIDTIARHLVEGLRTSPLSQEHVAKAIDQQFGVLAEAIGARRAWNFEANPDRPALDDDGVEAMLSEIDQEVGAHLTYPTPFEYEFGISTTRGLIVVKTAMAIFQAYRVKTISKLVSGCKILEIGPGLGRTAYYARELGLHDYTTIDLPLGIVGQACFLASALGPDNIWLMGDDPAAQSGRIRLLSPSVLQQNPEDFDVILNADSLTEMSAERAVAYMQYAQAHCKAFISINHELNPLRVKDIAKITGVPFDSVRGISNIRPGYVEDLFLFYLQNSITA
jgi:hypothetical protein